jgi:hypothetical protein
VYSVAINDDKVIVRRLFQIDAGDSGAMTELNAKAKRLE